MLADGLGGYLLFASLSLGLFALFVAVAIEIPILALTWWRWSWRLAVGVLLANLASALFVAISASRQLAWPMPGHDADPWSAAHTWWSALLAKAAALLLWTLLIELPIFVLLTWKERTLTKRRVLAGVAVCNLASYTALLALLILLPPRSDTLDFRPDTTWVSATAGRVWFVEPTDHHICSIALDGRDRRTEVPMSVYRWGWYLESHSLYAAVPARNLILYAGPDEHWHAWSDGQDRALAATSADAMPMRHYVWNSLHGALLESGLEAGEDPPADQVVFFSGTEERIGRNAESSRYVVRTDFRWLPGSDRWGIRVRDKLNGNTLRWGVKAGLNVLPCRDPVILEEVGLILFRCGGGIMVLDPQAGRIGLLARGDSVALAPAGPARLSEAPASAGQAGSTGINQRDVLRDFGVTVVGGQMHANRAWRSTRHRRWVGLTLRRREGRIGRGSGPGGRVTSGRAERTSRADGWQEQTLMDKNKFLIELSESTRTDFGKVEFSKQSAEQRVFSAIWALESEVNSGGFDCFFRYVETDVIAHAPVALKAIGALKCRTIVERAIAFIAPLPATEEGRGEALNALGAKGVEQLSKLDEEFYAYPDNLTSLLFDFVARHQPTFGAVPRT